MIYLGADHGGFELKNQIKEFLEDLGHECIDLGNTEFDKDDDYPVFAFRVAEQVAREDISEKPWKARTKGILVCRSAGGVIISANKVKGAYAIPVSDKKSAIHCRQHNDANIIALSGDWTNLEDAKEIVKIWLETEFSHEERHERRINMIKRYEKTH